MATPRTRTKSSAGRMESRKGNEYYAGALFDSAPSISDLPLPPTGWTGPALRSQSSPSSPVTVTNLGTSEVSQILRIPAYQYGGKDSSNVFKSSSFPGQIGNFEMMMNKEFKNRSPRGMGHGEQVFKKPDPKDFGVVYKAPPRPRPNYNFSPSSKGTPRVEKFTKLSSVSSPAPVTPVIKVMTSPKVATPTSVREGNPVGGKKARVSHKNEGLDLMNMLLRASSPTKGPSTPNKTVQQHSQGTPSRASSKPVSYAIDSCHGGDAGDNQNFQEISSHLKTLLKVTA